MQYTFPILKMSTVYIPYIEDAGLYTPIRFLCPVPIESVSVHGYR